MKLHRLLPLLLLSLISVVRAADSPPPATPVSTLPLKKVLFFTKSSGYEHSVIKQNAGQPSFAMQVLKEMGAKNNIEFTESKDGSLITPEYLAKFDAFMFYSQGNITTVGSQDRAPPMTPAGKEALLKAVADGKGFIGVHSATDTFHAGPGGYVSDGDATDPYVKMLGGEFVNHGQQQKSHVTVADPKFPGVAALPADFGPNEEWYSMKNFPSDLHVILVQDPKGMSGNDYARQPYPETWARMQGKGRVFYTSMGHREDVWMSDPFQSVLLGGLNWATGRVDADVTPNLDKVTPSANVLPKSAPRGGGRRGGAPGAPTTAPGTPPAAPTAPPAPPPVSVAPTTPPAV